MHIHVTSALVALVEIDCIKGLELESLFPSNIAFLFWLKHLWFWMWLVSNWQLFSKGTHICSRKSLIIMFPVRPKWFQDSILKIIIDVKLILYHNIPWKMTCITYSWCYNIWIWVCGRGCVAARMCSSSQELCTWCALCFVCGGYPWRICIWLICTIVQINHIHILQGYFAGKAAIIRLLSILVKQPREKCR